MVNASVSDVEDLGGLYEKYIALPSKVVYEGSGRLCSGCFQNGNSQLCINDITLTLRSRDVNDGNLVHRLMTQCHNYNVQLQRKQVYKQADIVN